MTSITHSRDDMQDVGAFLNGWGGVLAVVLGIAVAFALSPLVRELISMLHDLLIDLGMTADAAVATIYWLGMIAIGAGVVIALAGPDRRMDRLRSGVGDWPTVVREALIATVAFSLWFAAGSTWALYADEFNTLGNATELSALGVLVLIIAGAALYRWMRYRRSSRAGASHESRIDRAPQ